MVSVKEAATYFRPQSHTTKTFIANIENILQSENILQKERIWVSTERREGKQGKPSFSSYANTQVGATRV